MGFGVDNITSPVYYLKGNVMRHGGMGATTGAHAGWQDMGNRMNAIATINHGERSLPPALSMDENELMEVLTSSVYPGAKPSSVKLVIGVCRASGKDPLKKPYHIVPMNVKKAGTNKYEWQDVIMPGINDYRTDAARTGDHAGTTEPEFGQDMTLSFGGRDFTFPEWCKVSVFRIVQGKVVQFTAKEYWLENYATKSKDTDIPNAMWWKRPRGQIAKCAEAQALRKGFPEVGNQPTAEEMEGKVINDADSFQVVDGEARVAPERPREIQRPEEKQAEDAQFTEADDEPSREQKEPPKTKQEPQKKQVDNDKLASEGLLGLIKTKAQQKNIDVDTLFRHFGLITDNEPDWGKFNVLGEGQANEILLWIKGQ